MSQCFSAYRQTTHTFAFTADLGHLDLRHLHGASKWNHGDDDYDCKHYCNDIANHWVHSRTVKWGGVCNRHIAPQILMRCQVCCVVHGAFKSEQTWGSELWVKKQKLRWRRKESRVRVKQNTSIFVCLHSVLSLNFVKKTSLAGSSHSVLLRYPYDTDSELW